MANAKAESKSFVRTLVDGSGNTLQFNAAVRQDESVGTYVVHRIVGEDGKATSTSRGASATHASMAAAIKALEKQIEAAKGQGWHQRTVGGGYKAKPDAFDANALPKAKR